MPLASGPSGPDVYHSGNVFVNNVPVALWQPPADAATVILSLQQPDVSYVLEQADVDSIDDSNTATIETKVTAVIDAGTGTNLIPSTSTVLTTTTVGISDPSTVVPITGGLISNADWTKFNENNIPYDTLMLTEKTSLATFTTKAALWPRQPTPLGPNAVYVKGQSAGDNKHIKEQDYYVGGQKVGRITVPQILHNLSNLARNIYEPIKAQYPNVIVTNTFRQGPPGGASQQAQHGLGMAMDIVFAGVPNSGYYDTAKWIRDNLPVDQLLQEKAGNTIWIHVSHYSGFGYQVPKQNKVANLIVSPTYSFTPGLSQMS